jgi:hypothetical protein
MEVWKSVVVKRQWKTATTVDQAAIEVEGGIKMKGWKRASSKSEN